MCDVYLVAGACGFIGRHVSAQLARSGAKVIGVGHGSWPKDSWRKWGLSNWIQGEITKELLSQIETIPDGIINCAGESSVKSSFTEISSKRNKTLESGVEILKYAKEYAPMSRIVILSSAAVYGESRFLPIDEEASLNPISPYGNDKLKLEKLCEAEAATNNLSIVILRLFSIYGEELRKQLFWDACVKYMNDDFHFSGSGFEKRDWLHITDAVNLICAVINEATTDCCIFNGGSGKSTTIKEALELIAFYMGGQLTAEFSGISREGDPIGYEADISRAKTLGWSPEVDLESGVSTYCSWFKEIYG